MPETHTEEFRVNGEELLAKIKQLIHEGKTLDVIELLHQFQVETRRYLDILLVGLAPPEPQDGDEWVPLTVESSPAP